MQQQQHQVSQQHQQVPQQHHEHQAQVVLSQGTRSGSNYDGYRSPVAVTFGVILIICGLVSIICSSYVISIQSLRWSTPPFIMFSTSIHFNPYFQYGGGIWGGAMYVLTGCVSVSSVKRTQCTIISALSLSVVTCLVGIAFLVFAGYAVWFENSQIYGYSYNVHTFNSQTKHDKVSNALAVVICTMGIVGMAALLCIMITTSVVVCCQPCTGPSNNDNMVGPPTTSYVYMSGTGTSYVQHTGAYSVQQPGKYIVQPGMYAHQPGSYPQQNVVYAQHPTMFTQQTYAYTSQMPSEPVNTVYNGPPQPGPPQPSDTTQPHPVDIGHPDNIGMNPSFREDPPEYDDIMTAKL